MTLGCTNCGQDAEYFIPHGTRLAVQGEENVPRERLDAARRGIVRDPPPGFEPYRGDGSRRDLERWELKHDISSMAADEGRRGNATVNTKTKVTTTRAFREQNAANVVNAFDLAEAGGDRLAERRAGIDQPNSYDVDRFKEQVTTNVVDGTAPLVNNAVPVGAVAEEITATE